MSHPEANTVKFRKLFIKNKRFDK